MDPGVNGLLPGRSCSQSKSPRRSCARAILLMVLVLAIPIILVANPIDLTQPGWYDDADTDQLMQAMSPDSLAGLAVLVLAVFSVRGRLVISVGQKHGVTSRQEPVPRGPPLPVSMHAGIRVY
jgi:hypothetical protein